MAASNKHCIGRLAPGKGQKRGQGHKGQRRQR